MRRPRLAQMVPITCLLIDQEPSALRCSQLRTLITLPSSAVSPGV